MLSDARVKWIGDRAIPALGVEDAQWEGLITREGTADPGQRVMTGGFSPDGAEYTLKKFFSEETKAYTALFAYIDGEQGIRLHFEHSAVTGVCAYFVKTTDGPVEASAPAMPIDFGRCTADSLINLQLLVKEVYLPQLEPMAGSSLNGTSSSENDSKESRGKFGLGDNDSKEFRGSMLKFKMQIEQAIQQVKGDVDIRLELDPSIVIDDETVKNYDTVKKLEHALRKLKDKAQDVLAEVQANKTLPKTQGSGPLAEIEFWRQRNAKLSTSCEQFNGARIKQVQEVLRESGGQGEELEEQYANCLVELSKLYVEAKDNVKFLTTLERHFKNISSGKFSVILDTLPSMMNAIRMVWIISRHYNTDEKMVPLMELIASEIATKVRQRVNIKFILNGTNQEEKEGSNSGMASIQEAKEVLKMWKKAYLEVRAAIETSDTGKRWEFDRKKLFSHTDYMAQVCMNLSEVATVLDQFHKFFGPELRAVTGDAASIDEIAKKVEELVEPLESVPFDIFSRVEKGSWDIEMSQFHKSVGEIELMTHTFIDTSFQKLRSAEGAFDLLQNFKTIQSRDSINKRMMKKYEDILLQYSKELEGIRANYQMHRDNPPTFKNYPPVAGAISWAKGLYQRAKKPILRFRTMPDLLRIDSGEDVRQKYLAFARDVHEYIETKFRRWRDEVVGATDYLKQSILTTVKPILTTAKPSIKDDRDAAVTAADPKPPYFVNFSPRLNLLVRECKYLDRMGFDIPENALNVTLQENKYHGYATLLTTMLQRYHSLLDGLTDVETEVLQAQLEDVRRVLAAGFSPLNWRSQRISMYIEECNQKLNEFAGVVSQIHKSSSMIDEIVRQIESSVMITEADLPPDQEPIEVSEFYEKMERNRLSRMEELARRYKEIGPLLNKIEEIVAGTSTGSAPVLHSYYKYWEKRLYNAITHMVVGSMATFQALLNVREAKGADEPSPQRPLCKLSASLNGKDIVVSPTLQDIYKFLSKSVKHLVESAKFFVRWMHLTCKETDPQVVNEDEEPVVFSFYTDVAQNPHVIKMMVSLNQSIQRVFGILATYLDGWRTYDSGYGLWDAKRRARLEKLVDRFPDDVFFDKAMRIYDGIVADVRATPYQKDIQFLRIDCVAIAHGIIEVSSEWKESYGRIGHELAENVLTRITTTINELNAEISKDPKDLDTLKLVLNNVAGIQERSMDMELKYMDVNERYRTLRNYSIEVPEEQCVQANELGERWHQLVIDSKTKDLRLVRVKEQFRAVTREQALQFGEECKEMKKKFQTEGPGVSGIDLSEGVELVRQYERTLSEMRKRRGELVNAEGLFGLPITSYPGLNEVAAELERLQQIYGLYTKQDVFVNTMSSMLWAELDISQLESGIEALENECKKFPKNLKDSSTFVAVEAVILGFKDSIPLIASLKNDAMKKRHWDKMMELTGVTFDMNPKTFTLENLFAMELYKYGEDIAEVVTESMQEGKIENELKSVEATWASTTFELLPYKKPNGEVHGQQLKQADDIKLELEDNMLNLQTMSSSRYVTNFADQVRGWERSLNLVNECIDAWFVVQRKWMYLESIFIGAEDIRQQLPEEAKKFDAVDKAWKQIMVATAKDPNVVRACTTEGRFELLKSLSERLDKCQKSLSDYLDTKRNSFPRFFFISDDELLSVLGSSDPTSIQIHLLKLFDNVKFFKFGKNDASVDGMQEGGGAKEAFPLRTPAAIEGPVEAWMTNVETEMKVSLQQISKEGVFSYAKSKRTDWLEDNLGMVVLVGTQIWWTWEVEDVFREVVSGDKRAMKKLAVKLTDQLNDLVAMVRRKISSQTRKKVNTLLIVDVHGRDIVDAFVRDSILNAKEFDWESQLRYYWDKDIDDVMMKQCTGSFRYGYEYMGLNGRLVITALTDRCHMTITQALTFKLGTAPAGPAGTGKTETTKDLAKGMAIPCFVINCGEGLDFKAMGSTFSGLVQVGAWGCFDEFNRINIEVLSVVAAQIKSIQNALNDERDTCDIGMGDIYIKRSGGFATVGIFITMNPGYAGRTELPDNLKALFRPVTMILPDLMQICKIMLFSEGFEGAIPLAMKMTVLYQLAKEQLSKQFHYDFGLRALKSVLVMAGSMKRSSADLGEDVVLMRALRDSNMPKFVFEDVPLFQGLIGDLFPGLDCPRVTFEALKTEIEKYLEENDFRHPDDEVFQNQVDKIIQMYETQIVRHTTMIVGPTGGGKSVVLDALVAASLNSINSVVKTQIVNPKAQSVNELYGNMDPATRDWTDGVLSKLFRNLNQPLPAGKENEMRWIVFDGDVDAVWVENMNSVMDDNRLLTLPNGERIRLQTHCAMICETFDLQYASPATISRCGMVWVDPQNLGYTPYYVRWAKRRCSVPSREAELEPLTEMYEKYVKKCVDYVLEGMVDGQFVPRLKQVIPITNVDVVKQLCTSLDAFLPDAKSTPLERQQIEGIYLFSLTWSLGAALVGADREKFDKFLKDLSDGQTPSGSLYDSYYDTESNSWESWSDHVPAYRPPQPFVFYNVLVPTTDSILYTFFISKMMLTRNPVLFVGESGTAKTVTIQNYLNGLDEEANNILNMNFSSNTNSQDVQTNLEANIDKRTGAIYGPPTGKQLMVFVDDLNMPKVDLYGTQQPIALLHFLVGKGCMYDRENELDLHILKDLQFCAAMGPPGGGRNKTDPRFVALFNVYNLTSPTEDVLLNIYSEIIKNQINSSVFDGGIVAVGQKMPRCMLTVFHGIVDKLPPTPSKFHYIFNLRDLGRVCEGVCLATPDKFTTANDMVRLWRNEMTRIFSDRLNDVADVALVSGLISDVMSDAYPDAKDFAMQDPILYGDYQLAVQRLEDETAEDPRLYHDLGDYPTIRKIFDGVLEHYNTMHKSMTLVLFVMALEHLTRIYRILRMPRGNALLIGVGGSGKQSLTKLAAHTAGYSIFEISLSRGYGENEFREDLKELYKRLGGEPMVFLFTDAHVVEEGFLEYINNMLTTGLVPALFAQDEKDALINSVRAEVKAAGIVETSVNCWNYYVTKARGNLHILLAMSPSGDSLRIRCRNFPGMVSANVIDWFFPWPEDALQKVAEFFLKDEQQLEEQHRAKVITHLVHAHQSVVTFSTRFELELRRHYYVTPKNYLDLIDNYHTQLNKCNDDVSSASKRLEGGLTKLVEAAKDVGIMEIELKEKQVIVNEKTKNCEALIADIQEKSGVASEEQEKASVKQTEVEAKSKIIAVEKVKADEALSEAYPAVEAAAAALDNLKKDDLTDLKAINKPHDMVLTVCVGVTYLNPQKTSKDAMKAFASAKKDDLWSHCKKMLQTPNLLKCLKDYDKDNISSKAIKEVKKQIADVAKGAAKEGISAYDFMVGKSKAAAGLNVWLEAVDKYYDVAKQVEPLKQKVSSMEKEAGKAQADLEKLNTKLGALKEQLDTLNAGFAEANGELQGLKEEAMIMEKRLTAASKLITGLASERTRWEKDVTEFGAQQKRLVGDCLLSASFLSYAGAFTFDYRAQMVYHHLHDDVLEKGVPLTQPFTLEGLLTTDAKVQQWVGQGLPADEHSVQNGILTTMASRFPLCIDPQQQAVSWIKSKEAKSNLTVKTFNDSDFMKHLELAIQFGNPFLFESIDEEIDPMIDPILEKSWVQNGAQKLITLGDKTVEWDDNFRLYFTTKLANPHYSPEVMGKLMIVNYSVTKDGLANQLLNVVVGHEREDLEQQYKELVDEMSANTQLMAELEDSLLKNLSESEGNILDNEELIGTLEETKRKSVEITAKLDQATFTKAEITKTRSLYSPVAKRGSILYFTMSGLSLIMGMYELSLGSFLSVFITALDNAKRDVVLQKRLANLVKTVTENMYDYTCTGIFERHKLMFSFQMCSEIMDGEGTLNRKEVDFFLKGDTSIEAGGKAKPEGAKWISESGWKDLSFLNTSETMDENFRGISDGVEKNLDTWRKWYDLETPETEPLPMKYTEKLNGMQQLLVMRCFRPDRVYNAAKLFVMGEMGEKFVQPPVLDYARIFAQSTSMSPIVFILSPGADPQSDIQILGEQVGFTPPTKLKFVSLGQGQGPMALSFLESGYSRGQWVLLQNCHLMTSWLKTLEKRLETMLTPHEHFRLWLTTEPTDKFPLGIIQRSLKVVTEPPDGLKQNMRNSYSKIDQTMLDECPHWAFRPTLYVLVFLHAVVLERRKYGKIGWNVAYDFNESDFNISRRLLGLYLTKAFEDKDEVLPWGSLKFLVGAAMYGGRVSDDFDRRVLLTYMEEYMGDFLFDDNQKFYFSQSGFKYELPEHGPLEKYTSMVEALPLTNSPAVFGLHPNAEIGYFTIASKAMWHDLISLQPRTAGGEGGMSREDQIGNMAQDILKKVPAVVDLMIVRKGLGHVPTPEEVVLLQELERFNNLTKKMSLTLADLGRALVGEIGMSDELDALGDALFNSFLPSAWRRMSPDTQKSLGSWMNHFSHRHEQYVSWIENGSPTVMWLSGLQIPASYLTALVQSTCRARNWPLDKSKMYTKVVVYRQAAEVTEKLEAGCYIQGLYMEGAGWDMDVMQLKRQEPKVLVIDMPLLQVIPIEAAKLKLQNTLRTPVYVTQARRNAMGVGLVFVADLATTQHPSHWVVQGVAMMLNTDE
jgi:dynein heavy chain